MAYRASYPFRVFVSYSHVDKLLVEQIVMKLDSMGFLPLWDKDINPGKPFTQEIKELIARSHLFLPVITSHSSQRPWVHQETGFAIALNIPVLPICIGETPSEMIAEVQAITVKENLTDFVEQLSRVDLMHLVVPKPEKPFGVMAIAETAEQRPQYIVQYANWVSELGEYGLLRTQARFTIFSVPDEEVNAPIWDHREGDAKRPISLRQLQRNERQILESHARMAGCRLIIDPSASTFQAQGSEARKARLKVLLKFLKSMPKDKLAIAVSPRAQDTSLTMVGDYFTAESMAARPGGYVHTVLNSHPPTVLQRIQRFDKLFEEIQIQNPVTIEEVIQYIEKLLQEILMQDAPVRTVFGEITDFLATNPTPEEIIAYSLPDDLKVRAHELLERNGEGELSLDERDEMFDFVRVDQMMTLLKAKMKLKLKKASD